jgi:hypothetical protein
MRRSELSAVRFQHGGSSDLRTLDEHDATEKLVKTATKFRRGGRESSEAALD